MVLRTPAPSSMAGTILRARGAASIFMGRTPHELHDELCRAGLA